MRTPTCVLKSIAERAPVLDSDAADVLAWTAATFRDRWVVASNMQDAVLIDLAAAVKPNVSVLFLDTGYHFAETIGTRDAVASVYPDVQIVDAAADQTPAEQEAWFGPLNRTDPSRCCQLRKVIPLRRALAGYDAWVTGVRRVDSPGRADAPVVSWDDRHGLVKINPIVAWSDERFDQYVAEHQVLVNPLVAAGYPSIGCAPCTTRPLPGADPRSGRWAGLAKTECGLHG
ncbi:MAG TPA: phosphoadenylyl-sulfate reductase [Pseudonocardiaceae bacterium]|nr:phosphoadenylyl-sulfate reductase [Pseudonocardiaceae bacterium]